MNVSNTAQYSLNIQMCKDVGWLCPVMHVPSPGQIGHSDRAAQQNTRPGTRGCEILQLQEDEKLVVLAFSTYIFLNLVCTFHQTMRICIAQREL